MARFLRAFGPPLALFGTSVVFFLGYNTYLIDRSLERLQASLEVSTEARTINDTRLVAALLDESLMEELTKPTLDVTRVAMLEFSKSVSQTGQFDVQVKEIQSQMARVVALRRQERSAALRFLDRINRRMVRLVANLKTRVIQRFSPPMEPHVASPLLDEAQALERAWDLREAMERYHQFLAEHPRDEEQWQIRLKIGHGYHRLGQLDQAKALYRLVAGRSPRRSDQLLAHELLGRLEELAPLVTEEATLVEQVPWVTNPPERQALLYQLGLIRLQLFNIQEAKQQFEQVIVIAPTSPLGLKARYALAWAHKLREELDQALPLFEALGAAGTGDLAITSRYQSGDVYERLGRYDEAIATFQGLSQTVTESELVFLTKFRTGHTYLFGLQDAEAAKRIFQELGVQFDGMELLQAMQQDVFMAMVKELIEQGFAMVRSGALEVARLRFQKVLAIEPENLYASCGLAAVTAYAVGWEAGIEGMTELIAEHPDFFFAYAVLGYFQEQTGQLLEAIAAYQQAIRLEASYVDARFNMAYLLYRQGNLEEALEQYLAVTKLAPWWPEPYNNAGCLYWFKKQYEEAGRHFEEAARRGRHLAEAYFNVGLYYRLKDRPVPAIQAFESALELRPTLEAARRNLQELREQMLMREREGGDRPAPVR